MVLLHVNVLRNGLGKTSFSEAVKMFGIDASYIRRFGKNVESQDSEDYIAKVYPHPQDSTENKKPKKDARDDDVVSKALSNAPIKEFSFSFLAGCVTGYATKIAAKLVAVVLGLGFIGIQVAQYQGWISIDWTYIEDKLVETADQDADSKLTKKDLEIIWQRAKKILIKHVPKSTAFLSGFLLGFYRG